MKLKDRVAIVTGSAQGIGKGIAKRFASEGATVIINDLNQEEAEKTAQEINSAGGKAVTSIADVSESQPVIEIFSKTVEKFNRVDILVNNVGIAGDRRVTDLTVDEWDKVIKTNLRSYFLCSREAAKIMINQQYGRIINISSRAWLGAFGQSSYSASKGAIVSLTRTMALELVKKGITVNSIAPGVIDTPMIRAYSQEIQDRLLGLQPMGIFGKIEDVAYAAAFFASQEAWYITGQILYVCGGKSLSSASI